MIKYLIMDVDGTLIDGKIYMGPNGEAMKAFSIKDGYVVNYILKPAGIKPVIITARTSSIVQNRCKELGITEVYQGKTDKQRTLMDIVGDNNLSHCAYFGDDIIDINCMQPIKDAGGIVGCPADAVREVKQLSDYVCINKAGEGALREFTEWLITEKRDVRDIKRRVDAAVNYLQSIDVSLKDIGKKIKVNDDFYYNIQYYDTKSPDLCDFESHRKYIDIQFMVSGKECLEFSDISRLSVKQSYNENLDVMFWNVPENISKIVLSEGDYIVLYPEMAHRGAVICQKSEKVLKIVGKVRI